MTPDQLKWLHTRSLKMVPQSALDEINSNSTGDATILSACWVGYGALLQTIVFDDSGVWSATWLYNSDSERIKLQKVERCT
jgi:hypothetical protein